MKREKRRQRNQRKRGKVRKKKRKIKERKGGERKKRERRKILLGKIKRSGKVYHNTLTNMIEKELSKGTIKL